jgi:hypothetical protein
MTLGVYSHAAKEDDMRLAAQLGEILDPSGPFLKSKGPAVGRQALVKEQLELVAGVGFEPTAIASLRKHIWERFGKDL